MKLYKWLITLAAGIGGFLFGYEATVIKYVNFLYFPTTYFSICSQIFVMSGFTLQFGIQKYNSDGKLVDTDQAAEIKGWV